MESELRAFSRRLTGRGDARTVRIVVFAVVEAPFAAVRRHVVAKEAPPRSVDVLIRTTYEAVTALLGIAATPDRHRVPTAEKQARRT